MSFNEKGVSTLGEFIILIGVILVSALFLLSFQKTVTQQTEVAKEMSVKEISERISGLMNRIESEPSYTILTIKIPKTSVRIENGVLTVKRQGETFSESVPQSSKDVFLNDTLKVVFVKEGDKIILSDKAPICNFNFFCEPKECFSDCEDCYGPSPTCVGDGNCTKAIGETCRNSPQDCACADGKECCPTHPDSDERSCLDITERKDRGEQCYCDNQCSDNLKCNPTHRTFKEFERGCCPKGETWTGDKCKKIKIYDIVYVPLYYSPNEFGKFKAKAEKSFNHLVSKSPFRECDSPKSRIKMHLIKPKDCQKTCGGGRSPICTTCPRAGKNCVLNDPKLRNKWDKIIVLCKGKSCKGSLGCSPGAPADVSASNMGPNSRIEAYKLPTHEAGHSFGLYHIKGCGAAKACQGCNAADCNEPDTASMIMDYCNGMERYGPHGYECLKNNAFNGYLKGC